MTPHHWRGEGEGATPLKVPPRGYIFTIKPFRGGMGPTASNRPATASAPARTDRRIVTRRSSRQVRPLDALLTDAYGKLRPRPASRTGRRLNSPGVSGASQGTRLFGGG
ncbi:hypothetical protein GCM10009544_14820 [Streptomyces stramineus]|uniref:Uncharacterized protein n=1 Tax=Streptomyces stramineus TaxID=173861 RepID=A0ABP3JGM2_9ACTN